SPVQDQPAQLRQVALSDSIGDLRICSDAVLDALQPLRLSDKDFAPQRLLPGNCDARIGAGGKRFPLHADSDEHPESEDESKRDEERDPGTKPHRRRSSWLAGGLSPLDQMDSHHEKRNHGKLKSKRQLEIAV